MLTQDNHCGLPRAAGAVPISPAAPDSLLSRRTLLGGLAGTAAGAVALSALPMPSARAERTADAQLATVAQWDLRLGHAEDQSGNGHHGTPSSGVSFTSNGAHFDGTDDGEITIPYSPDLQPESIADDGLWRVALEGVVPGSVGGNHQAVVGGRSRIGGWVVYITPSGQIEFWMEQVGGDSQWASVSSGVAASPGGSYDVVAEWDAEQISVTVSGDGNGNGKAPIGVAYSPMGTDQPVRIGNGGNWGAEFFYSGRVGAVSIALDPGTPNPYTPDQMFFGVWDGEAGDWAEPGRLDYGAVPALAEVEAAVTAGDYDLACQELLTYFRGRETRETPNWSGNHHPGMEPLYLDHIWTLGDGEIIQDVVAIPPTSSTVSADVSGALVQVAEAGSSSVSFFLMARRKTPTTFAFTSRHAASGTPVLEVTMDDGSQASFPATADTHITAGENSSTNFGTAKQLLVKDDGTGPFTDTTSKAFLTFDLSGLTGTPASARLLLTGSQDGDEDHEVMVFHTLETFDETSRTWDSTVQNTFSWQGDPGGFDWMPPPGADNEYSVQLSRFYMVGALVDEYQDSGDETWAAGVRDLMIDFIADADASPSPYGAGSYTRGLDAAIRTGNWLHSIERLRASESISAADLAAILRTLDKKGQFLAVATTGPPNWLTSQMSSLTNISLYFPEFTGSGEWVVLAGEFLSGQLASDIYPDGGFVEASGSYAYGTAATFIGLHQRFRENGYELGGLEDLHALTLFLADQTYPNGLYPAYGDGSPTDRRGSLKALAELLEEPTLTYIATAGEEGTAPDHTSVHYPDTRVAILRSNWATNTRYLRINADRGNHSHPDDLAVTVYVDGRELIPETGTFTYSSDARSTWLRRTTEAQSTVEIDGKAQIVDTGTAGGISTFTTNDVFDVVRIWTDATPGVRHTRTVLFLRPQLWLITDHLAPEDEQEHTYRQNWHFLPDAGPQLDPSTGATTTSFAEGPNLWIVPGEDEVAAELRAGYYSPEFYSVTDSTFLTYERSAAGATAFATVLMPVAGTAAPQPELEQISVPDIEPGAASAGRLQIDGRTAHYCVYHGDEPTPVARRFGDYTSDALMAYVERDRQRQRWLIHRGREISDGNVLISSPEEIEQMAVEADPSTGVVAITGSGLVPDTSTDTAIAMGAPWARTVTLNGQEIPFEQHGRTIFAVAVD